MQRELRENWLSLSNSQRLRILNDETVDLHERVIYASSWACLARESQYYPKNMPDCKAQLFLGAYGSGKSWTGSHWLVDQFKQGYKKLALMADTLGNAKKTMIEGESGLIKAFEKEGIECRVVLSGPHKRVELNELNFFIDVYSAEAGIDALKGNAYDAIWIDEQCCYRNGIDIWNELMMRTRSRASGLPTKIFSSTTPEVTDLLLFQIKGMINAEVKGNELLVTDQIINDDGYIWVTTAATADNRDNLDPATQAVWDSVYKGTRFEDVFLKGRVILEVQGALWSRELIERNTVEEVPHLDEFQEVNVYMDPAVTSKKTSDATGIIVVGSHQNGLIYVWGERELRERPSACMDEAVSLYKINRCDFIKAERNNGGDYLEEVLENIDPNVCYDSTYSSKGKRVRARPISAMTEKGRIRFVRGECDILIEQLTTCSFSGDSSETEDVADAFIIGANDLLFKEDVGVL